MEIDIDIITRFIFEWGFPGIFMLIGILMIIFRKAFGNANYEIMKSYGEIFKSKDGEPWGLFKTLTPNFLTWKNERREKHQKLMIITGIMLIIMSLFLFVLLRGTFR